MTRDVAVRVVIGLLALYHLIIGVLSVSSFAATARATGALYGLRLEATPQLRYAVRMLGLYALTLSAMLLLAFADAERYRGVILAVCGLLLARAGARVAWRRELSEAFGVPPRRNALSVALLLGEAAVLLVALAA